MALQDKVAIVTGGGSGIGRAIAARFCREGARVVVADINAEAGARVAAELGDRVASIPTDVADSGQVGALFAEVVRCHGTLDVLVNNAGIGELGPGDSDKFMKVLGEIMNEGRARSSLEITSTMSDERWRRMVEVHLFGTFYCTREALRIMEPRGAGHIVNIASVAGLSGIPGLAHYGAAKAGIIGFTKSVAPEVIPRGIYVNAVAPGLIDTPMVHAADDLFINATMMRVPIGRMASPDEVASVVHFLATEESSYVVGQVISPNGGLYL
jgi:3-oxoacyl-[acyl-carrier protein] reductase